MVRRLQIQAPGRVGLAAAVLLLAFSESSVRGQQQKGDGQEGFRFRSTAELVNVTATVTDASGRFVPGLRREDFLVYEDGVLQNVSHFSNERVPVSLGIALDTSGSMAGEKIVAAQNAIDRFLFELLDPADEIFLYRFSGEPELIQDWTVDRNQLSRALGRVTPHGGTAMYDAVAEAVPLAENGRNRKKALLLISDGNDTNSRIEVPELKQLIRESEVLVYAIGIDGTGQPTMTSGGMPRNPRPFPIPFPFPLPGGRRRTPWPLPQPTGPGASGGYGAADRVNDGALRELTDDSGGRTEVIRHSRDLDPATASVADELSKQYYLGYPATGKKDGRWHTIRVEVRDRTLRVRARRGYVAS